MAGGELMLDQRSPNSEGQQPKSQSIPQTRARTGAPPTDARSEHSGKRQQRRQRLARTKEANATTHRRPHTARLPLAEPNTGRARDMHCTHEGTEAENGQSARAGYCTKKARSRNGAVPGILGRSNNLPTNSKYEPCQFGQRRGTPEVPEYKTLHLPCDVSSHLGGGPC